MHDIYSFGTYGNKKLKNFRKKIPDGLKATEKKKNPWRTGFINGSISKEKNSTYMRGLLYTEGGGCLLLILYGKNLWTENPLVLSTSNGGVIPK